MTTTNYLSGYAFAKKVGDQIHVFEPNAGVADNLPVVANGSDTPRTLKDRFADVVNVKDFGAVGDGVTDDTKAIQAALDRAGVVFFPEGVYAKSDALCIKSDTTVIGHGATIKNIVGTASRWMTNGRCLAPSDMTEYDSTHDIAIIGLTFAGNGSDPNGSVGIGYCKNLTISGCRFINTGHWHAIELMSVDGATISGCQFSGYYSVGGVDSSIGEAIQLDASYSSGSPGPLGSGNGLPCRRIVVEKCYFNGLPVGIGSHYAVSDGIIYDVYVRYCSFEDCKKGVSFKSVRGVTLDGNAFYNCTLPIEAAEITKEASADSTGALSNVALPCSSWKILNTRVKVFSSSSPVIKVGERVPTPSSEDSLLPFYDLEIDRLVVETEDTATEASANVLDINRVSNLAIRDVLINTGKGFSTHAMYLPGCTDVDISGCVFVLDDSRQQAITTLTGSTYFIPQAVSVHDNRVVSSKRGFNLSNCGYVSVVRNAVSASNIGINILAASSASICSNRVVSADCGINLGGGSADVTLADNSISAPTPYSGSTIWNEKHGVPFGDIALNSQNRRVSSVGANLKLSHIGDDGDHDVLTVFYDASTQNPKVYPEGDGVALLGGASRRWSQIYAATDAINTSDARVKAAVANPDEALMRAWGKVNFRVFQFKDAVEKKGAGARLHVGVIAQQVIEAFASEGLDATRYGLLCYDKWDDEYEDVEVVDTPEVVAEDGAVTPAQTHIERRLVTPAGDRYGIRYGEALALECAYQRWRLDKIEAALKQ